MRFSHDGSTATMFSFGNMRLDAGSDLITTDRLVPAQNAVWDFGSTGARWKTLFCTNVDAAGNINATGDMFINRTVGVGTTNPLDKLHVAGDIRVGTGTSGCVKDANGTVIAGICSSDLRLKKEIKPFPPVLEKLAKLQPVHFYWKTDEYPELNLGSDQSFGLVAQEVEKILPELVTLDERGFKAVRYHELPLLTIQAIKELNQTIEVLKAANEAMNNAIQEQQKQIEKLRSKLYGER
jgi:hypothetical protein